MSRTPDRFFPEAVPDVAGTAAALADRSRAAMCAALMDGRAWTVGELGSYAGVARSTASEHVDVLEAHGLITRVRQGRHCYITISGPETARVVEALGAMSASVLPTAHSLSAWTANKRLLTARTCYRHLAGRLGVSLAKHLQERGHLDPSWRLTDSGGDLLATWGLEKPRRARGEACMDSTERQFHLGGPLGTALTQAFFDRAWITRIGRTRAVKVTAAGREALAQAGLADVLTLLDETTSNDAAG
ncbi:winged helix-turn-helix transcriptional regulator [Actinomyces sp. oral taxon 169]|uniref:ArsR/SmtB family transcription factor n=1 Tax=Actinomyces sp. oral taxon 169 TaxID=712116 RepID=UPI0015FEB178|nr:winged helix-turn-helix domain-containing protein [Actinomyces sp. oral taxon 169]QLF52653.1 winged helix-turn-helix transcriptional regulator [Actinomyces sp. oral taxon 169]